jgi:protoporphyrinogen oxidase
VRRKYDVEFKNDMPVGHLAFESNQFPITGNRQSEYVIVGGGIAGMSAAYKLREKDFLLFELSKTLGGSSSGSTIENTPLCHGAHYDLSYPSYYGSETLEMLEELRIIQFDQFTGSWKFMDKEYLIPKINESQTFAHGSFRADVLPDETDKIKFIDLMKSFFGRMPMPTRLISNDLRSLNDVSFRDWLKGKVSVSDDFIEGLDYHMKDDYGAGCDHVSALAGIHYFACRPYYAKPVELFSPPEGNFYFIKKIQDALPRDRIITSHLVKMIHEKDGKFEVEIVNALTREITLVTCKKIIYSGHKHALKYVYPKDYPLFFEVAYAPWIVVNLLLSKSWEGKAFWQNELITADRSLLGFVDSKAQFSRNNHQRVLTVYYCFTPEERQMMSLVEERKNTFIDQTVKYVENYFKRSLRDCIEKIYIKQMGHAMPIPKPGYLFKDGNEARSNPNLVYAGVDNGRLPLLFEAIDSGIVASNLLS